MRFRALILVLSVAACGGSNPGSGGTAGSSVAGAAGSSGTAGTHGGGGTGGAGGTGGTAGTVGTGGSATGDRGGTGGGGTSGTAGSAGTGGSANGGAGGSSSAGTSGTAGTAGTGGSANAGAGGTGGRGGTSGTAGTVGTGGSGNAGGQGNSPCLSSGFGGAAGYLGQAGSGATGGSGAGGQGGGSACTCPAGLSIEVQGDGAPLSLTSADVSRIAFKGSQCLASAPPWAEDTNGQVYRLEWIQACAGPGAQPPCLLLYPMANCTDSSTYTDRTGRAFMGKVLVFTNWNVNSSLMDVVEGDYEMVLEDGRTLSGHLRVCLIARITWS